MRDKGVGFNEFTLMSVLTACGRLSNIESGNCIAEYIKRNGLKKNLGLMTSLVNIYGKCGKFETARICLIKYFREMLMLLYGVP